jgi:phospholipid/cholesterol/gamma-HCH transport system permease protein
VTAPVFQLETLTDAAGQTLVVNLSGDWIFDNAAAVEASLQQLDVPAGVQVEFRCAELDHIDLTGAWLLYSKSLELQEDGYRTKFTGFKDVHMKFLSHVIERPVGDQASVRQKPGVFASVMEYTGRGAVEFVHELGEMTMMTIDGIRRPSALAYRETVNQLMDVGLKAIPIIVVMSFLIGIVLAYQAQGQLARLGAGAYTIDLVAISILREMGVLLTAIMVAGRSGSAFAAALGSMKLNEETDAMQVMGLSVNGTLILPRILGLVIAVPILTALSDLSGIGGAWAVGVLLLDISTLEFSTRLVDAVDLSTVMVGISKAPAFAVLIGAVSCLRGLQVSASAEELGQLTTRAVVESIFLVIIADAIFSIIYTELGI